MSSLQERLENLQVTMLDVMIKYGNLKKLEVNIDSYDDGGVDADDGGVVDDGDVGGDGDDL